jgi:hypothetical protein
VSNIRFLETYALYLTAAYGPGLLLPPYFLAGVGAGAAALTPIIVIRAYTPPVRFSGISFSYNLAYALLGGLTPLFVSWITRFNGINPAHYVDSDGGRSSRHICCPCSKDVRGCQSAMIKS